MADRNTPANSGAIKLDRIEDMLRTLKGDARQANEQNDLFMVSVYNDLIAVMSPIVVRAHARIEREDRATFNKAEKLMRKAEREAKAVEKEAAQARNNAQ